MQNQEKSLDECPTTKFNHYEWLFKSCDVVLFMLEKLLLLGSNTGYAPIGNCTTHPFYNY